jgi:PPK2 family polyphosphate:nucleotide phosphotransferase
MGMASKVRKGFRLDKLATDGELPDKAAYKKRLHRLQLEMLQIQLAYRRERRRGVVVIEGGDAAGKGGAIKRLVKTLDPRGYKVYSIGRPNPDDQARHYLYRFWQRLPEPGSIVVFDRSWYGRVLVERVEGLAAPEAWGRAYDEINEFERMLVDDGIRLAKVFLHVSKDEQLRRFRARLKAPDKRWKMTPEDMRNRAHWDEYMAAYDDMFGRTSTRHARWQAIAADDKRFARVAVAKAVTDVLAKDVDLASPAVPPEFVKAALDHFGMAMLDELGLERP